MQFWRAMPWPEDLILVRNVLRCLSCRHSAWDLQETSGALFVVCRHCSRRHRYSSGVLFLDNPDEHEDAIRERNAVSTTELAPELGGWSERYTGAERIDAALRSAYLSLPYGDGSSRFATPGYFANVRHFAEEFDFVVSQLGPSDQRLLLDVGADSTWSTARLAAHGFRSVAIDVTNHLILGEVYQPTVPPYGRVLVDMHAPAFVDQAFDVIVAFNALHHSSRLRELARHIAAMLKPGGILGFVEPYVQNEAQRSVFGQTQSDAGINENVHDVRDWHDAFVSAGLSLVTCALTDSYNGIYRKQPGSRDPFADAYHARVECITTHRSARVGTPAGFHVVVSNDGSTAWASRGPKPTRIGYHLYRIVHGRETLVAFDNPRTEVIGFIAAGEARNVTVQITFDQPGDYAVEFDLVHETVSWFKDRGGKTSTAYCTVS